MKPYTQNHPGKMNRTLLIILTLLSCFGNACRKDLPMEIVVAKKVMVSTVAGDGNFGFSDGPALESRLKFPFDVVVNAGGDLYIADGYNHRIRKLSGGVLSSFAGSATRDTVNGNGSAAGFTLPICLTIDNNGNIYTLDADDGRIRKITPSADVSTYAGNTDFGFKDGNASTALFGQGFGILTDLAGNIFMTDAVNHRVREITRTGQVLTIAGNDSAGFENGKGILASFNFPEGIAMDKEGNLFVADLNRIRKITPAGDVTTFAGSGISGFADGAPAVAMFSDLKDMVADASGNLFVADENRIRKIAPDGFVTTIAGGEGGFADGDADSARFSLPEGLGIDREGNIYVADSNNHRIRKISFQ